MKASNGQKLRTCKKRIKSFKPEIQIPKQFFTGLLITMKFRLRTFRGFTVNQNSLEIW